MQKGTIVLAAAVMLFATAELAQAADGGRVGVQNSWWDQVEKAQACAMQPGNPFAYSMNSPCPASSAAYADARRAYPGYYGYSAYSYGYGQAYPGYRYGYGYGY